jgi:hypothetical protein
MSFNRPPAPILEMRAKKEKDKMQVTFNHDNEKRSITLIPEDDLEILVLTQIHDRVEKGQTVQIGKVVTPEGPIEFRFEVKVHGHQAKVTRQTIRETYPISENDESSVIVRKA